MTCDDDERDEAALALDAVLVRLFVGGLVAYGVWLLFRVVAS
jgi:hypothetical protein